MKFSDLQIMSTKSFGVEPLLITTPRGVELFTTQFSYIQNQKSEYGIEYYRNPVLNISSNSLTNMMKSAKKDMLGYQWMPLYMEVAAILYMNGKGCGHLKIALGLMSKKRWKSLID